MVEAHGRAGSVAASSIPEVWEGHGLVGGPFPNAAATAVISSDDADDVGVVRIQGLKDDGAGGQLAFAEEVALQGLTDLPVASGDAVWRINSLTYAEAGSQNRGNIDLSLATLVPIDAQDETSYDGAPATEGSFAGGTGHAGSDVITLSDGTLITVDLVSAGVVTEFTVDSSASTGATSGVAIEQVSTTGSGTGFSLTPLADNLTAGSWLLSRIAAGAGRSGAAVWSLGPKDRLLVRTAYAALLAGAATDRAMVTWQMRPVGGTWLTAGVPAGLQANGTSVTTAAFDLPVPPGWEVRAGAEDISGSPTILAGFIGQETRTS